MKITIELQTACESCGTIHAIEAVQLSEVYEFATHVYVCPLTKTAHLICHLETYTKETKSHDPEARESGRERRDVR